LDGGVVQLGDLAEEDPGDHRAGQWQRPVAARDDVVGDDHGAEVDRHLHRGAAGAGQAARRRGERECG
jgi:hypothetical protein